MRSNFRPNIRLATNILLVIGTFAIALKIAPIAEVYQEKNLLNKSDRYLSWLPITKSRIKKYPYMGVATMALGAIIFLVSGGANSIN